MKIQLDFISSERLSGMKPMEKIDLILNKIKKDIIVVLEEGLTPEEEKELIEATMREIDIENFHGIEFYRIDHKASFRDKLAFYLTGKKQTGLTIVGPAKMIEAIKREPEGVITMIAKLMPGL